MTQYKAFKVADLFDHAELGDTNLKKTDLTKNGDLVITSGKTNCGILGRTTRPAKVFPENTITVDMFGYVYYRDFPYKLVTHGRVMSLASNIIKNREVGLYLASSLSYLSNVFGYNNMATWKKLQGKELELPVTPAGDPDFGYMTMRIRELEAERIRELEAYLRVTGLNDTTLSTSEAQALTQDVKWKKFRIGDVFDIHPSARKINANAVKFDGHYPYVARGTSTNGIRGYIDWDTNDLNPANTISFGQDTATIYYQDKPYFTGDKIQIFELKDRFPKLNGETAQFMIACMNAVFGDYTWGQQSFAVKKLREAEFLLPVASDGQIDFNYMQNYIRATEKQTIKGVVEYKDRVIAETKKVVGK